LPLNKFISPNTISASLLLEVLLSGLIGLVQFLGYSKTLTPWVNVAPLGEAFANLLQRNQFASLTSIGLLALQWQEIHLYTPQPKGGFHSIAMTLLAFGNAASGSRTGATQWVIRCDDSGVYPLWYGPFQMAVALCIWMLWHTPVQAGGDEAKQPQTTTLTASAATILIAICGYVGWDYWRISLIYLAPAARNAAYRDDTLAKIQGSWLFRDQVRFAELTTTTLTVDNAAHINALARDLLHFSPESRVVEKVIESAVMLGDDAQALFFLQRYKAAFPTQHARWSAMPKSPQ
jgi:hypothetical protein